MQTVVRLPHEGRVPTLPGRTNTGEMYINMYSRAYEGRSARYIVRRNIRPGSPAGHFPLTIEGFTAAVVYRDAIRAGQPVPQANKDLLTIEEIDELAFPISAQRDSFLGADYQHHERDKARARRGELFAFSFLREAWNAVVTDVTAERRYGCDALVTMPDGQLRFVEVKTGGIKLTETQYRRALAERENYYIAIVDPIAERIELIQDPIGSRYITAVTEYHVRGEK